MMTILWHACQAHKKVKGVRGGGWGQYTSWERREELDWYCICPWDVWLVIIREDGLMHVWRLEMRLWAKEGRGLDHKCMPKIGEVKGLHPREDMTQSETTHQHKEMTRTLPCLPLTEVWVWVYPGLPCWSINIKTSPRLLLSLDNLKDVKIILLREDTSPH